MFFITLVELREKRHCLLTFRLTEEEIVGENGRISLSPSLLIIGLFLNFFIVPNSPQHSVFCIFYAASEQRKHINHTSMTINLNRECLFARETVYKDSK